MKLGVAIPCFHRHIDHCKRLLESLEHQTRIPDSVVVSCSSTEAFPTHAYAFPLRIVTHTERKNAAQNRNIAKSHLHTDIVCFFDADDQMHPQRLEAIAHAMEHGADLVLHNYYFNEECAEKEFTPITQFHPERNTLRQAKSGCIALPSHGRIAHGHVSVKQRILDHVWYPEEKDYETREDCVFCYRAFDLPNLQTAYFHEPLSKYIPSNSIIDSVRK
jgi:glycosyltransferase involved in cell wall biosynthesis